MDDHHISLMFVYGSICVTLGFLAGLGSFGWFGWNWILFGVSLCAFFGSGLHLIDHLGDKWIWMRQRTHDMRTESNELRIVRELRYLTPEGMTYLVNRGHYLITTFQDGKPRRYIRTPLGEWSEEVAIEFFQYPDDKFMRPVRSYGEGATWSDGQRKRDGAAAFIAFCLDNHFAEGPDKSEKMWRPGGREAAIIACGLEVDAGVKELG